MKAPRAVMYARVSTAMQERDGVSLDAQIDMARRFCESRGFTLVDTLHDTMSGQKDTRPGLTRLEELVAGKLVDHVIVYKIDRLSRDAAHYHRLLQTFMAKEIGLKSMTEDFDATTSMGRFVLGMLIGIAALEADRTADRVRDSCHYRAAQGRLLMGKDRPMGYAYIKAHTNAEGLRVPGRLEVDPATAVVVRFLFERYIETQSVRLVTLEANNLGFRWNTGGLINQQSVRLVLRSPLYCGKHASLKTRTIGTGNTKRTIKLPRSEWLMTDHEQPAIVSQDLWERVQATFEANAQVPRKVRASRLVYPWSGLLRCGFCGGAMSRGMFTSGRDRTHKLPRYRCSRWLQYREAGCTGPLFIAEHYLDALVWPAIALAVTKAIQSSRSQRPRVKRAAVRSIDPTATLKQLDARRLRILESYNLMQYTREEKDALMAALAVEVEAAQALGEQAPKANPMPDLSADLMDVWKAAADHPGGRNQLLRSLIQYVEASRSEVRVFFHVYDHPDWPTSPLVVAVIKMSSREGLPHARQHPEHG